MATKIILTVDDGLSGQEVRDLTYLFTDALQDFAVRRTPVRDYVRGRYPDQVNDMTKTGKIAHVERRIDLARKLHNAALGHSVYEDPQ